MEHALGIAVRIPARKRAAATGLVAPPCAVSPHARETLRFHPYSPRAFRRRERCVSCAAGERDGRAATNCT
jgi:hypothetical protein